MPVAKGQVSIPVLEAILHQFPFQIVGFHADNGSEYINHTVAGLLEKLRIEFTKSRANRSQDNALVEGKNGAVIRKHIGYGHIASEHAELLQKFYTAHFNPYLNFHRPCGFATVSWDARGKRQRRYPAQDYATPYEKLKSLPEAEQYLRPELSLARLERDRIPDERHRFGPEDGARQGEAVAEVQDGIADPATVQVKAGAEPDCGNDGALQSLENQKQVFHPSQRSLEISQRRRDSHIPTGPTASPLSPNKTGEGGRTAGYGKVEIQKQDSHFPTAPKAACGARKKIIKKRQKGAVLRSLPITRFMLILHWNRSRFHAHPWIGKCCTLPNHTATLTHGMATAVEHLTIASNI
jgi:hypothetical protein